LTRDEAGNIIDPQGVRQRSLDDACHVAAEKQRRLDESNKKAKLANVTKLKTLSKSEFRAFWLTSYYSKPKNNSSEFFWRSEHEMIHRQIYAPMSTKVCPMKYTNIQLLYKDEYFHDALWVTEKLGLHRLMSLKQDYCPNLIQQFYATLEFDSE
jgi:hypothetical protein